MDTALFKPMFRGTDEGVDPISSMREERSEQCV
jgi:hypothetical protein